MASTQTLTLEEPRQLIHELLPKYKSHADVALIHSIQSKFNAFQAARQKTLDACNETLSGWKRKVEMAQVEASRPAHLSPERHLEKLAEIEGKKFSLIKSIRDTELAIEHAETQYDKMQVEYAELRKLNTEQTDFTETELKLRIYRSLGMAILDELPTDLSTDKEDPEAASIPVRVRLHSHNKSDVHSMTIDEKKYTNYFYSNYIWEVTSTNN